MRIAGFCLFAASVLLTVGLLKASSSAALSATEPALIINMAPDRIPETDPFTSDPPAAEPDLPSPASPTPTTGRETSPVGREQPVPEADRRRVLLAVYDGMSLAGLTVVIHEQLRRDEVEHALKVLECLDPDRVQQVMDRLTETDALRAAVLRQRLDAGRASSSPTSLETAPPLPPKVE